MYAMSDRDLDEKGFEQETYSSGTWNVVYRIPKSSRLALGIPRGIFGDLRTRVWLLKGKEDYDTG